VDLAELVAAFKIAGRAARDRSVAMSAQMVTGAPTFSWTGIRALRKQSTETRCRSFA
jgi:hypothetical protein